MPTDRSSAPPTPAERPAPTPPAAAPRAGRKVALFQPLAIRGVTLRNRIGVAPMCQYSASDGVANEWHFVHLASRAVGGAGLVISEATAVTASGRISPHDLGIWTDAQAEALAPITRAVRAAGAAPGIQLAHAGRKASTRRPWEAIPGSSAPVPESEGGWREVVAPSAIPFAPDALTPVALSGEGIAGVVRAFAEAARRALAAGFEVAEIHAAHGYLLHEFLSPLSNHRADGYGGSFENRTRIVREVVDAVRAVWPERLPLFVRVSATDWAEGGWTPDETVALSRDLAARGVDLVDCSSGGVVPNVSIPVGPGYQTAFAERVRREAGTLSAAVGLIRSAEQAEHILRTGQADLVLLARAVLADPYWPLHASRQLGATIDYWPAQYLRAME